MAIFATLVVAACGNDNGSGDEQAFCTALRTVHEHDAQAQQVMQQGGDWPTVQRLLADDSGALSNSYGRAEDAAPKDLRQPVKAMREFTEEAARMAARSTSIQEFTSLVVADRTRAMNAGRASETVDAYTRANCGFSVSNEGAQ